jgi:preprotein translocase subunit SecG
MIYGLLVFLHVVICFFLVIVVLLQSGKAADLAGAFGGMGSQTAFGPRGTATILSRLTRYAAALFMITSLTLAILATRGTGGPGTSVLQEPSSRTAQPASKQPRPASLPPAPVQFPGGGSGTRVAIPIQPKGAAPAAPAQQAPAAPAK